MKNTSDSSGLNGHSANGVKFWLPGRVLRARRDDDSFEGETPASRDSQYRTKILRQIPDTNFGMKEDVTAEYISAAHAAAGTGQPIGEVQRRGRLMFDAVWIDQRGRIEAKRDSAQLKLNAVQEERAVLQREREATPRVLEQRDGKLTLPSGIVRFGFFGVAAVLVLMLGSEWLSAAILRVFDLQSLLRALLVTTPMLAFAIAPKLLFRRTASPAMQKLQIGFHIVGAVAALTWGVTLALNFAPRYFNADSAPLATSAVVTFTVAQFIGCFFGSAWLTLLLTSMLQPNTTVPSNPDWLRMTKELRELDTEIAGLLVAMRGEDAELAAYTSSRDAWIAKGEEAHQRSTAALALIEERLRLLKNA